MEIAVLIYCYRLASTSADYSLRLIFKVNTDTSVFCLHIDECNVVFRKHRMSHTTDLNLDRAIIKSCHYRYMLLHACIYRICYKFLHLFTAAYYRNLRINNFHNNVTAMAASVKFNSHDIYYLIVYNPYYNDSERLANLSVTKVNINFIKTMPI